MNVFTTRDDVHAGDGAESRRFTVALGMQPEEILTLAADRAWLPSIHGDRATWSIVSNQVLAVLAYEWPEIRFMSFLAERMREADWRGGTLFLHFNYHAQDDPETVHRVLKNLRLRS